MEQSKECPICAENYTRRIRSPILCPQPECEFTCCTRCIRTYVTTDENIDQNGDWEPRCMQCKNPFNLLFIKSHFPNTFDKEIRKKKARIDLSIEMQLTLQPHIQLKAKMERNAVENVPLIKEQQENLSRLYQEIRANKRYTQYLRNKGNASSYVPSRDYWTQILEQSGELKRDKKEKKNKVHFACECPSKDCRGVMDEKFNCTQCDIHLCKRCEKQKEEGHECKKEDVDSVVFKKRTCKACPGCSRPTFRRFGCNQMWCTAQDCRVFWNWSTGMAIRGGVRHNPEYLEFLRANPGVTVRPDNPQGEFCYTVRDIVQLERAIPADHFRWSGLQRLVDHLSAVVIPVLRTERNSQDLAISFVAKKISKKTWQRSLQSRRKLKDKNGECARAYEYFCLAARAILSNLKEDPTRWRELRTVSLANLVDEVNSKLKSISQSMKMQTAAFLVKEYPARHRVQMHNEHGLVFKERVSHHKGRGENPKYNLRSI